MTLQSIYSVLSHPVLHKSILLYSGLFILSVSLNAQDTTKQKLLLIGTEFGGGKTTYTPLGEPHLYRSSLRISPFVGYCFDYHWSAGLAGSYEYVNSNYDFQDPAYGIGGYIQYLHLLRPKSEPKETFTGRFHVLSRLTYHRTNYFLGWDNRQFTQVFSGRLTENALFVDVGFSIRVFKQFHFQNFLRYDLFLRRSQHVAYRIGLSYHFHH